MSGAAETDRMAAVGGRTREGNGGIGRSTERERFHFPMDAGDGSAVAATSNGPVNTARCLRSSGGREDPYVRDTGNSRRRSIEERTLREAAGGRS